MAPSTARLAIVRDYNLALAAPIRWVHVAVAGTALLLRPPLGWARDPRRRDWAVPLLIAVSAFLLGPMLFGGALDLWVYRLARTESLGGDVRRVLETLQQWGAISSIVIASIVIWRMDPPRRRRLLDWYGALIVLAPVVSGLKILIGRPRPRAGVSAPDGSLIEFPGEILWPWGAWPVEGAGVRHAWEFWADIGSDLWSMPSSHTAYAAAMSVFIGTVYPRLRGLAVVMAVIVGVARVVLGAHYPADVVVGACVGYAIAHPGVRRRWGERAAAGLRRRWRRTPRGGGAGGAGATTENVAGSD